jgi:dipeptidyl aminopeptidase/acylaminoacyl peptidase
MIQCVFKLQPKKRLLSVALLIFLLPAFSSAQQLDTVKRGKLHSFIYNYVQQQIKVRSIFQVTLSPDGKTVAWCCDGANGSQVIYYAPLNHPEKASRISAAPANKYCNENEPQWSPDGKEIAFLSDHNSPGKSQIFTVRINSFGLSDTDQLTNLDGYVSHLKWSPDGKKISVLYVKKASREPNPMAAENRAVGVIDLLVNMDIQRIALVDKTTKQAHMISPGKLYVFEYDWSPDSKNLAYTAALPPGDDNWYIAHLFRQNINDTSAKTIYKPSFQIALPRWSPDGNRIAFIEGLMSDQGGTGGEIYTIAANGNSQPKDLTQGRKSTPAWLCWRPDGNMLFTEFVGGSNAINSLNTATGETTRLWQAEASVTASSEERSLSIAGNINSPVLAFVCMGWSMLPEVWAGNPNKIKQITHLNSGINLLLPKSENIEWVHDGQQMQGWLLYPTNYNPAKRYPMLVMVHGGPAWIATPTWSAPDFNTGLFTQQGYFIFFPNARGSYGQGEKFTQANRRDWGFGDLQDILNGVDVINKRLLIDSNRLGLLGWSYGGSMAMFSVTQTDRFKAVVCGAGAADWLSYYGQNSIDKWMNSYFGASPYDNPEAYKRVSAMTYIKKVKTPVLLLVGEHDGECPPAQSMQYWHALKELKIPTQLVIYPDEGHDFQRLENTIDVTLRTLEWFNNYLKPVNQ